MCCAALVISALASIQQALASGQLQLCNTVEMKRAVSRRFSQDQVLPCAVCENNLYQLDLYLQLGRHMGLGTITHTLA